MGVPTEKRPRYNKHISNRLIILAPMKQEITINTAAANNNSNNAEALQSSIHILAFSNVCFFSEQELFNEAGEIKFPQNITFNFSLFWPVADLSLSLINASFEKNSTPRWHCLQAKS